MADLESMDEDELRVEAQKAILRKIISFGGHPNPSGQAIEALAAAWAWLERPDQSHGGTASASK